MSQAVETSRIRTRIPGRLDRLPWSRWHWMVLIGLGTVWILDGLEVTIVGALGARLSASRAAAWGISTSAGRGLGGGALRRRRVRRGALVLRLSDRPLGRKRLFLVTLGCTWLATVLDGVLVQRRDGSLLLRFFTGIGIGGEYAAINSAIDELIPARAAGESTSLVNGSVLARRGARARCCRSSC